MKDSILESLENMYLVKQHASEYKVELTDKEKKKIDKAAGTPAPKLHCPSFSSVPFPFLCIFP